MSALHFDSIGPCFPAAPSIRPFSWATPKTLHEGYSLQARLNVPFGSAPPSVVVVPVPVSVPPGGVLVGQPVKNTVRRAKDSANVADVRFMGWLRERGRE